MRIILKILKWLTVVFVTLVIVMFAINWKDQPLSPAAVKMRSLLEEGSDVADVENAFVYAMGFAAPKGSDPIRAGVECIAKLNAAVHKSTINFDSDLSCEGDSSPKHNNAIILKILNTCAKPDKYCENALRENEQVIAKWLRDEAWFLDRYERLLGLSKWHMSTEFSLYMHFPPYEGVSDGRRMLLLKAWYLSGQGKSVEVQRLLNQDARFWRIVLSSSNTLLDKMIATAFLGNDFSFANLVLRRLHEKGITSSVPDEWLIPFEGDELSLKKAMAGEWAYIVSALQEAKIRRSFLIDGSDISNAKERTTIDVWLDDLLNYFFLSQATQNEYAEMLLQLVEILDVPVRRLPFALQQKDAYVKEFNLIGLFNPVGHILVGIGMPVYSGYAERVYDLEGARRAVLATTQLRENEISADQVVSALDQTELKNPYDGKPFEWNAETNSIVFKGLGTDERNTHSFLY